MRIGVLDHGFVNREDYMASDLKAVNAARISYRRKKESLGVDDEDLIQRLIRDGHGSPFEHCVFTFRVKAPLFVIAQWKRHRIASWNQESFRYSNAKPEFYVPVDDPGQHIEYESQAAYAVYELLRGRGYPKEKARMVLPQNMYSEFLWTINVRSLMNFLWQRGPGGNAQNEIQQYAQAVEDLWNPIMPVTAKAFNDNERKAP